MNTYKNGTLYIGNIIKIVNGNKITAKENAFLIYSQNEDCFYTLDVLNYLLDLETNNNLSEEEKREYKEIVEANRYQYKDITDEQVYIDESSVKEAFSKNKTK